MSLYTKSWVSVLPSVRPAAFLNLCNLQSDDP